MQNGNEKKNKERKYIKLNRRKDIKNENQQKYRRNKKEKIN